MRFVLGNRLLASAGGTEVHLLTVGDALRRLGHEVVLYAPQLGPFAEHLRRLGLQVEGELGGLPDDCDVVLAQDRIVVYDLLERYPAAFHAFRICGDVWDMQLPPQLPGAIDLVVALSERYARVAGACAVQVPLLRLRVPIDLDLTVPVGALRSRPRRAVLLGNYPERDGAVRAAWEPHGLEIARIGAGAQRYDLAAALDGADIVVAKSRAALDAMACGRAVYIYDVFGGDGWVTAESYQAMEADNFAGQATGRVIDAAALAHDLAAYDPAMGATNRDLVAQHHGARDHAVELLSAVRAGTRAARPGARPAYAPLPDAPPPDAPHPDAPQPHDVPPPHAPLRELARLTASQWYWEHRVHELHHERAALVARVLRAEQRLAELERTADDALRHTQEAARLQAEIDRMRATRAWRTAVRYWRLRERRQPL